MRLTDFTDFGLRAMMRLASEPGRSFTADEIAAEFNISRHHLTKIVRDLATGGYLTTQRGAGGGMRLTNPPETVPLGMLVRYLERRQAMVECFEPQGGACVLTPRCKLKGRLMSAREAFYRDLDRSTLADCAYPARRTAA